MFVELISVEDREFQGSADCLRYVAHKIRGEFIFMSSDILCQFDIAELVNIHRLKATDVTIALYAAPIEEPDKKGGKPKLKIDDQDQEYIGITDTGRIMMKMPTLEIEEYVNISKPLLHHEKFKLRTDLIDSGMYVFSRWIIDLLLSNEKLLTIRSDLIPFLIKRQFQSKAYFLENLPILFTRTRNLYVLDKWLVYQDLKTKQLEMLSLTQNTTTHRRYKELSDFILEDINNNSSSYYSSSNLAGSDNRRKSSLFLHQGDMFENNDKKIFNSTSTNINMTTKQAINSISNSSTSAHNSTKDISNRQVPDSSNRQVADNMSRQVADEDILKNSVMMTSADNEYDLLRCYAYVCEFSPNYTKGLLQRMTTISSYLNMNRLVLNCQSYC